MVEIERIELFLRAMDVDTDLTGEAYRTGARMPFKPPPKQSTGRIQGDVITQLDALRRLEQEGIALENESYAGEVIPEAEKRLQEEKSKKERKPRKTKEEMEQPRREGYQANRRIADEVIGHIYDLGIGPELESYADALNWEGFYARANRTEWEEMKRRYDRAFYNTMHPGDVPIDVLQRELHDITREMVTRELMAKANEKHTSVGQLTKHIQKKESKKIAEKKQAEREAKREPGLAEKFEKSVKNRAEELEKAQKERNEAEWKRLDEVTQKAHRQRMRRRKEEEKEELQNQLRKYEREYLLLGGGNQLREDMLNLRGRIRALNAETLQNYQEHPPPERVVEGYRFVDVPSLLQQPPTPEAMKMLQEKYAQKRLEEHKARRKVHYMRPFHRVSAPTEEPSEIPMPNYGYKPLKIPGWDLGPLAGPIQQNVDPELLEGVELDKDEFEELPPAVPYEEWPDRLRFQENAWDTGQRIALGPNELPPKSALQVEAERRGISMHDIMLKRDIPSPLSTPLPSPEREVATPPVAYEDISTDTPPSTPPPIDVDELFNRYTGDELTEEEQRWLAIQRQREQRLLEEQRQREEDEEMQNLL